MSLTGSKSISHCYVCGPDNPAGLHVHFEPDGEMGSIGRYTARAEHCGWEGILHGGITFALMDEAFGWSLYFRNIAAVTARVATKFHKPIRVGTAVVVRAAVVKQRRRLFEAHAELRLDGPDNTLLAEADAVMCTINEEREESPVEAGTTSA